MAASKALSRAFQGIQNVKDEVARTIRLDSWINTLTGLGGLKDRTMGGAVAALSVLAPIELEALYHGNDLAAKIVDRQVKDALRQGFEIAGDEKGETAAALRAWGVSGLLEEAGIWGRLYGAGAILIGLDEPMDAPLDVDKIRPGSLKYLMVLDRQNLTIEDYHTDPTQAEFGEPRSYRIEHSSTATSGLGSVVHASRLIMFGGAMTAERVRIAKNGGFDLSVLQRPNAILRDADQSWRSVMNLVQDLSQAVFAVEGLIDMIAEGERDTMLARMEIVDMARSVARAVVIDAESERYEHKGAANVSGIDPLMMMVFQRLAAAADMPLTILFGMSPGGMNATGESDTRGWYDVVQSYRDAKLTPQLQTLVRIVEADAGRPIAIDEEPEIVWPSLWQPTPTEQSALDKTEAETDKILIDAGILFPEEVTLAKFLDDPTYRDVIDFAARETKLVEPEPDPVVTPEMIAAQALPPPGAPGGPPTVPEIPAPDPNAIP